MERKISRYGWQPDLPDQRDYQFKAPPVFLKKLPPKIDLRPKCPPVYDQASWEAALQTLLVPHLNLS